MGISVSKAKALVELVRAFDEKDERRVRKIGTVISQSIKKDSLNQEYSEFIELDKKTKPLFPQNVRSNSRKSIDKMNRKENSVIIKTDNGNYTIEISDEIRIIEKNKKE